MAIMIAGAVIAGGTAIAKGIHGYKQNRDAKAEIANLEKPEFQIPQEILDNMSLSETRSYQGLPDAQKREFLNNIQNQQQQALSQSASRKGGLGMVSDLYAQQQSGLNTLMIQDIQAREQNIEKMMNARREVAQMRLQKFEHEFSDYSSQMDYLRSQESAGTQNMFSAADDLGAAAVGYGTGMQQKDMNASLATIAKNNQTIDPNMFKSSDFQGFNTNTSTRNFMDLGNQGGTIGDAPVRYDHMGQPIENG